MVEIGFIIKSLVLSIFVVFCLQCEMGGQTVETHITAYMRHSVAAKWMRQIGGAAGDITVTAYKKGMSKIGVNPNLLKATRSAASVVDEQVEAINRATRERDQRILNIENE